MAALLVAMAVMAILMSAALPVWRHEAQREKEEELVFRGQQYIRALRLYSSRTQTLPASVDMLVNGHFIRKKYKDPITGEDFELIGAGGVPGQQGGPQAQGGRGAQPQPQAQQGSGFGGTVSGGIMGVRSKSKEESIRLYQGRNHYNEWTFLYVQQQPGGPGRGGPQRGGPQRGGPQGGPQRGGPGGVPGPGGFGTPGGFPGPGGAGRGGPPPSGRGRIGGGRL